MPHKILTENVAVLLAYVKVLTKDRMTYNYTASTAKENFRGFLKCSHGNKKYIELKHEDFGPYSQALEWWFKEIKNAHDDVILSCGECRKDLQKLKKN